MGRPQPAILIDAALEESAAAWRDKRIGIEQRLVANYGRLWETPADPSSRWLMVLLARYAGPEACSSDRLAVGVA
jgi:hypothetical protein